MITAQYRAYNTPIMTAASRFRRPLSFCLQVVMDMDYCSVGLPGTLYALYCRMADCLGLRDLYGALTSLGIARYGLIGLYD